MKKTYKIAKKITLFVLVFSFLLISTGVLPNIIPTENPNKIMLSADTWNSDLVEIEYGTTPNEFIYKSISDYVILGVKPEEEGLVIGVNNDNYSKINKNTVFKIENGLDLYYFSELCNPTFSSGYSNDKYTEFLKFNYILGANINYEDASQTFKMLRPIGWKDGHPFEGTFDGQGHTISNIFYRPFESKEEAANYDGLIYLSLFSVNAGTIKNVGIINPNMIQYDHYEGIHYVTPFIGLNKKLVENCYVQDLRGNNAGMSAEGGYTTTMFAAANAAPYMVFDPIDNEEKKIIPTIKNCYVAVDRITSHTITMTDKEHRHPFIEVNAGTITHCYYDKEIIATNQIEDKLEEIHGLNALNTEDFLDQTKFIYYEESESGIVDQIWFSNSTYEDEYSSYLKLKYPVLRGFETTIFNDEEYFAIKEANDLVLMSEYIDQYQAFRTASYLLVNSVDLNTVSENAFIFTDAVFSGKLIGATNNSDGYSVTLADGNTSNHTSIFNLKINKGNSYNGYRAYGLFSVLSGTVENINLVNVTINESDITENNLNLSEINTLGAVCGLLEGGTINNVNIKVDITLDNGTSTFLGTQQVGGITGTVLDGSILNSTTTGELKSTTYDNPGTLTKKDSHSIGGIVGKVESCDAIANCLNNIKINNINYSTDPGTAVRQYIGGVIGSGNISNTYELQNNMFINVNNVDNVFEKDQHNCYYSIVYVGGVIGRVNNATLSNGVYLNNADINYDVNDNNYKAYISGVMNVISDVADNYDTFTYRNLTHETVQKELKGQTQFKFTSLSNAGLLNISNKLNASKYPAKYSIFTNDVTAATGIDIRAAGITYSYLTNIKAEGAYNLYQRYVRENGSIKKVDNNVQQIDVSMIDEYAPTFNADNKVAFENNELGLDTNYLSVKTALQTTVELERVYNYADLNYVTNGEVNSYMMQLSGCVNGRNFNLTNIRNEGDIKVYFTDDASALSYRQQTYGNYFSDHKKLKIFGVMEEVSLNHTAKDIYNGGNITFSSETGIAPNYNLYIAGICYKNVGNDDTSNQKLLLERGYVGSLHNAVNNGDIRTTNGNILENDNLVTPCTVYGYSRIGGITCINSSTISQTFNLGDLYNINHIQAPTGTANVNHPTDGHFEVETGGICYIMQNEEYDTSNKLTSSNIIDSANNGTVIAMNTAVESQVGGNPNGFTNAGGFVARNDRSEDGYRVDQDDSNCSDSHLSKIQYSINYGDVYAYNAIQRIKYSTEQQSKAAGFVCLGACTIVDTINYGNIYGNSVSAGIFGYLYIQRMKAAGMGPDSPIFIANSVNYGQVKVLQMTDSNKTNIPICRSINYKPDVYDEIPTSGNMDGQTTLRTTGALIGVWAHIQNNDDLNSMIIKYLINFVDDLNILGVGDTGYGTSNAVITSKYNMLENMATTNPNDTSPAPFDTDNNNHRYGIKSYYKDSSAGNKSLTDIYSQAYNGGIFNENYSIRIPGELTYDANGNIDQNDTDNFISDYIQFVPYSKVNEYLMEKIGLKETVEANAYANALTNVTLIKQILLVKHSDSIDTVYNELLAQNEQILKNEKYDIANAIKKYLDTNPDKADDIAKVLIEDKVAVQQVLSSTDIQNILSDLIENLSEDAIEAYLIDIINEYGLDEYLNEPSNLDVMGEIINAYANQVDLTDAQRNLVLNLFDLLSQNNNALEAYGESLTDAEKDTISNSIYNLVQNDQTVLEAISNTYFEQLVVNNTNFNNLKTQIINNKINNNISDLYPISDDEYIQMYENVYYNGYTDPDVEDAINELNNNNLKTLVNNIVTAVGNNTSNKMYEFLDSGRSNTNNLYLPATATNYVAIINTTDFTYVSSEGTACTNQDYTGTNQGTGNNPNNLVEIYVENQANYYPLEFSAYSMFGGTQTTNGAVYWTLYNGDFRTAGANNDNRNNYKVSISTGSSVNNDFITHEMPHTGVFATTQAANAQFTSNRTAYRIGSYHFNDVDYFTYINYGSGAIAKNGGNLTLEMVNQLNTLVQTNANATTIKNYLYNIYINSQVDKTEFLKLLFNPQAVTINNALTYLNNNLTADNMEVALLGITNPTARANIVKLLNNNNKGYGEIVPAMVKALDSANNYEQVKAIIGGLVSGGYSAYNGNKTSAETAITNMLYSNGEVWDGLTYKQKEAIVLYYFSITELGLNLLTEAVKNGNIGVAEYQKLVYQLMLIDPYNLHTYKNDLNDDLSDEVKAEISAIIISNSESLFIKYTELSNDNIIEKLEDLKIDSSIVTDFTGIYALASSQGIKAGLFLPDNINLIQIDEYEIIDGKKVNDPTWRGGSASYPNTYYKVDEKTGELIVDSNGDLIPNVGSVNYKVYYEMKQLKLSIATTIFKMELTDEDNEFVLDNNLEVDYACNEKVIVDGVPELDENGNHKVINEVTFYVPVNHDILKKQKLLINMDSNTYELSYGAKFDVISNKFEINLDGTYEVKDVLTDTFVVQAEDENVKTIYTLNVIITPPAYLDEEVSVEVDGVESIIVKDRKELQSLNHEFVTNIIANSPVSGYNGKIKISYTTKNMMNGLSLLSNLNIYKTQLNTLPNDFTMIDFEQYKETLLVKDKDYVFNKEEHNGIVQIEDEKYTGFDTTTNGYKDGKVFFNISLSNYQSKGIYLVEIVINKDAKYYVFFEKAASSENSLSSLIFNGNEFLNNSSLNNNNTIDDISKIEYGTPLTEEFFNSDKAYIQNSVFESISGLLNPNYFANYESNICIYDKESFNINAPNGTFIIGLKQNTSGDNYYVSEMFDVNTFNNNNNWDYLITIPNDSDKKSVFNNVKLDDLAEVILVDDIVTVNFIEENYLDGIITSPLSTFKIGDVSVTSAVNEQGIKLYTYAVQIIITAEDGSPNTFIHYITEEVYESEIDKVFINGGVDSFEQDPNITYSYVGSFEKNEMPTYRFDYMLDKFYINNDKSYFDVQFYDKNGEVMEVPYGVYVNVTDGLGFNVEFSSDALSQDYYFALVYKNMVEFRTGETNNWNVTFDVINIKKEKNRDSYLDNISFFSESVTASIRTIITSDSILELENHTELNLDVYKGYLTNPSRKIACLPDKIYYNDFEWRLSYDENGKPIIENKENGFYVVGLVNKTQLDYYTPDFTLPEDATIYRTKEIDGVIYRYVPYFVDNELVLTNFLISEDGSILRDSIEKEHNIISLPAGATDYSQFTWDDPSDDKGEQLYKISSVAGYQTIVIDGQTIENTSLRTDFNEFGSYDKDLDVFNYVNYRVYSEMYSENADASYYTDYYVTAQDLTNNIKFDIEIEYSGKLYEEVSNVFVELVCYALKEGITDTDSENINDYTLYNKAGIFSYFNDKNELKHEALRSNVSGFYSLYVSVPDGYEVKLVVFDDLNPNKEDSEEDQGHEYLMNQEFLVRSHIVAREIKIIVTITEIENYTPDWGVHVQENSNKK